MIIDPQDLNVCQEMIRIGSQSFYAASKLLPKYVRDPAIVLYAFCRLADDAVDEVSEVKDPVKALKARLELVYKKEPKNYAPDRAFSALVNAYDMPRELPEALLEGLEWDFKGYRFETLSDLYSYSARVASSVGVMMCVLMNVRDKDALARACDLGVAMQLTNIARDVGEDARNGRIYIPLTWMREKKISIDDFLKDPKSNEHISSFVKSLLDEADRLYRRAGAGLFTLPKSCRPGVFSARHIYAQIGKHIVSAKYDSINRRAYTSKIEKLGLLMLSLSDTALTTLMPTPAVVHAPALKEVQFLVDAAANDEKEEKFFMNRSKAFLSTLFLKSTT